MTREEYLFVENPKGFRSYRKTKKRLSQNKLEMASVVSFQIEVIWISLKR